MKGILNRNFIIGFVVVLIFIGLSFMELSIFEAMERYIYDTEMRFSPAESQGDKKIVLIDIDDKSVNRLGPWPWPRHLIAEMITVLKRNNTRLIGLHLPLTEKEQNQGLREVRSFKTKFNAQPFARKDPNMFNWLVKNLEQLEEDLDNDSRLVESVRQSGNVILPLVGQFGDYNKRPKSKSRKDPYLSRNFLAPTNISPSLNKRLSFNRLSLPYVELTQTALGLGHGNVESGKHMAGRSHPMFINYKGSILPSFPLRIAIAYFRQKPKKVVVEKNSIRFNDYSIPLVDGEMLIKFKKASNSFLRYSFVDLLEAKKVSKVFSGKIILIGLNTTGSKRINTPISPSMSQVELIAHVLDNTINKSQMVRPPFMGYIEIFTLLLLGGFSSFLFPRFGQFRMIGWAVGLIVLPVAAGITLFIMMDIWFKTSYIVSCLVVIYLFMSISQAITGERTTEESIETNRLLGLSFQSQGLLDLAFDKFRKIPLNNETKDLIYNLGLEYEKKRKIEKAISVYEYINKGRGFRDLNDRIPKLKGDDSSSTLGSYGGIQDATIVDDSYVEAKSKVGRYEILEELGKGSMGLVYKALDPKINRTVAIKTIRFSDEFEEDVIQDIKERFFREAEIAGQLSHPSIVTIYDVGEDRDLTYMTMEFLEGQDFENYISKGNLLPFTQVLDAISKVAYALDFAHKADVIHRDIKPANIMLLKNAQIKVTDFGIAKALSSSRTKTGVILGTPNYMSPEQIMGQKIDHRSDIFSLGVLFFQMITGELPFHGENLSSLLYQITQVKQPSVRNYNRKIPKACEQIIDKAMEKNPDHRFAGAGDMAKVIRILASKIDEVMQKRATQ
jgi:serine/threonine-protein kinase